MAASHYAGDTGKGHMSANGRIRPMRPDDVEAVGKLFMQVFRQSEAPPSRALSDYFRLVCFGAPAYGEDVGSIVHEDAEGVVDGAITITPIRFVCGDMVLTGRELANYMADDTKGRKGATDLALTLRARNQDLAFSETARPVSADMVKAMGAVILPIQSLEWTRVFRPCGAVVRLMQRRGGVYARIPAMPLAKLGDLVATRVFKRLDPPREGVIAGPVERDEFVALAPQMVAHYGLRPLWEPAELNWLIDRAAERTRNGPLVLRKVTDGRGTVIGLAAYLGGPGMIANVLNILARKNREVEVIQALLALMDAEGNVAARGTAQPIQLEAMCRIPGMLFRHNAYSYVLSKHAAVVDAARRNDIYMGGLAGEGWSRLVSETF